MTNKKDNNIMKETVLVILALGMLCLGCSFSIDVGQPGQLEQQIDLPSSYYEGN